MSRTMNKIESKENVKVKLLQKLKLKKYREEFNQSVVEGLRVVLQVIDYGKEPQMIFFEENYFSSDANCKALYEKYPDKSYMLPEKLFSNISDTINPQGILAVFEKPKSNLEEVLGASFCRMILLDGIQDPGNVGTIIRTAESAGFDAIFYTKGTVDIFSEKVNRASMGANFYLPIMPLSTSEMEYIKSKGIKIFCTMLDKQSKDYSKVDYGCKYMIALGNEANGIQVEIANLADEKIHIPMRGRAESLNVAVAGGIVMYKSLENR